MLTIFAVPKPFAGHIARIQRNAIASWLSLHPRCEVILFGDDEGTEACARDFGVGWIGDVAKSEYGTPLLDDVFRKAEEASSEPLICYVNADIIIPKSFTQAVSRLPFKKYLMIGQRVDVDFGEDFNLADPDAEVQMHRLVSRRGSLHPPLGSDYFVFPTGSMGTLPPFAVGRPGWDNWMIYRARKLHLPVVDVSQTVLVVHQNHDYAHVPGGDGGSYEGPEGADNLALMGSPEHVLTTEDATWALADAGLHRQRCRWKDRDRCLSTMRVLHPRLDSALRLIQRILGIIDRILRGRS